MHYWAIDRVWDMLRTRASVILGLLVIATVGSIVCWYFPSREKLRPRVQSGEPEARISKPKDSKESKEWQRIDKEKTNPFESWTLNLDGTEVKSGTRFVWKAETPLLATLQTTLAAGIESIPERVYFDILTKSRQGTWAILSNLYADSMTGEGRKRRFLKKLRPLKAGEYRLVVRGFAQTFATINLIIE